MVQNIVEDKQPSGARQEDGGRSVPTRRCICCRSNGKKFALLRFGVIEGVLCFDLRKKLPGRGYYVCARRSCLEKAFKSGFKRVTKCDPGEPGGDVDAFIGDVLLPGLRKRYSECLLAGMQSGKLVLGADQTELMAKTDGLACYVLATDASSSTVQKYTANAARKGVPCLGLYDRAFYGHLLGRSDKVVMGWLPCPLYDEFHEIESSIRRLEGLQEISGDTASDKG